MADNLPDTLFIKELIRRVQTELLESKKQRDAAGQEALFAVDSMTIEVNFVVTRSGAGKGGLDFKIITAGGEKSYENQQVQKITLNLKAVLQSGDGLTELDGAATGFRPRE